MSGLSCPAEPCRTDQSRLAIVTRPARDAERLALPLRQRGWPVLVEPLLDIRLRPPDSLPAETMAQLAQARGVLLTSANGVRAVAALCSPAQRQELPALCVGDQTARVAAEAGFARISSAGGDVTSLAALVCRQCHPGEGSLFHATASVQAGELATTLAGAGFDVHTAVLYDSVAASAVSPALHQALQQAAAGVGTSGVQTAAFFYSPRTAATFVRLIGEAALQPLMARLSFWCLSPAVAEALSEFQSPRIYVAASPTQQSLLELFDRCFRPAVNPASG